MSTSAPTSPGRYSIYTGRVTNWPMVASSAALAVPLLLLGNQGDRTGRDTAIPLLLAAAVVLGNAATATSIRTAAGPNGVSVRFGWLGWPRCAYRLDQIARAAVVDLPPWRVALGFWWTPRRTNCTVRSGPALELTLRSGRTVVVSVPDAPAALAAIHEAKAA